MLVHIDGFDSYSTGSDLAFQYTSTSFPTVGTNLGRFGQGAITSNSYRNYITKIFSAPVTEIWTGFALNLSGNSTQYVILSIVSNSGIETTLNYNTTTNVIAAYRGDATTQIGTSAVTPLNNTGWHYIEFHYKISSSVGIVEVWVDDRVIFTNTGQNTTQYANTSFTSIWLGGDGNNAVAATFDDWYVLDPTQGAFNTTRLGDSRIQTLRPASDAGPNNGTPSTGSAHYAMVNAPQNDGGSTYIT